MAQAVQAERLAVLAADWFQGQAAAVGQARDFVRGVLGSTWPGLDDLLLMVSEVASNAVRHTASGDSSGWFDLTVSAAGYTVRIAIADGGGSSEPLIPDGSGEFGMLTGGRGLRIVDALADRWGYTGDKLGRVVWFELTGKPAG
jgi:anti-sigma regulatory factor (Ser/Thr protein kinase)